MTETFRFIGLMSGSSLDGLDIACCDFTIVDGRWQFAMPHVACVAFDDAWRARLKDAHAMTGRDLWQLHADFGQFCGNAVRRFVDDNAIAHVIAVASHGHTVFHAPQNGFTTQIGDGAALATAAGLPVICDFRGGDVAKGGQGAPLVPVGDRLLFGDYRFLLNIGGIANMTARDGDKTVAFDICSANQVLNTHAAQRGMAYDAGGAMASVGRLNDALLDKLNALPFYAAPYPKSLGNDYARDVLAPIMAQSNLSVEDKLHNFCEHIAMQVARHVAAVNPAPDDTMLASGGGVCNDHLMARLAHHLPVRLVRADDDVVAYKEALIFAFLGLLRWRGETNVLCEVTGASADSVGGAIYLP